MSSGGKRESGLKKVWAIRKTQVTYLHSLMYQILHPLWELFMCWSLICWRLLLIALLQEFVLNDMYWPLGAVRKRASHLHASVYSSVKNQTKLQSKCWQCTFFSVHKYAETFHFFRFRHWQCCAKAVVGEDQEKIRFWLKTSVSFQQTRLEILTSRR